MIVTIKVRLRWVVGINLNHIPLCLSWTMMISLWIWDNFVHSNLCRMEFFLFFSISRRLFFYFSNFFNVNISPLETDMDWNPHLDWHLKRDVRSFFTISFLKRNFNLGTWRELLNVTLTILRQLFNSDLSTSALLNLFQEILRSKKNLFF